MKEKNSIRKCEIVQQIRYLPGFPDNWQKELETRLEQEPNIRAWAYILHDKDIDIAGNPKEPHVHIVLELVDAVKFSTVGNYVGVAAQYVMRIKQQYSAGKRWFADIGGALSYLTHRNAADRYQYDDSEVKAKPGYDWKEVRRKSEERRSEYQTLQKVLDDIQEGRIKRFNIYNHVSQEMYIKYNSQIDKAFEHQEGLMKNSSNKRNTTVIYICGSAGSGKTTYAKQYCEDNNLSYCISASSRDPLQDYEGQDAIILDDLRPENFSLSDLLKLLDNHTASSASARYHDRWVNAKVIIITTVLPIENFFDRINLRDEPIQQLYRRCRIMLRMTHDKLELFIYQESIGEYELYGSKENPITKKYAQEQQNTSEEALRQICESFGLEYKPEGLPSDYVLEDAPF